MARKPAAERRNEVKAGIGNDPAFAYSALPGVADEMVDNTGAVRPVWQNLLSALSRMSEQELMERFARADRYLRDAGVFYRAYGATGVSEREWPQPSTLALGRISYFMRPGPHDVRAEDWAAYLKFADRYIKGK